MEAVYVVMVSYSDTSVMPKVKVCRSYDKALEVMNQMGIEERRKLSNCNYGEDEGNETQMSVNSNSDEIFVTDACGEEWALIVVKHVMVEKED